LELQLPRPESKLCTASYRVFILDNKFYIPQLNEYRRIWIYLPPDYEQNLERRYPVVYAQDGQNLFDAATSFSGEWAIDDNLNALFQQNNENALIVIGIDNGSDTRTYEYSPYPHKKFGGGGAKDYANFLVKNLKPYIDANYRTLADQPNTGLLGSSLGGLFTLYGGLKHPDIFGKLFVFSPSFWFSEKIYQKAKEFKKNHSQRIYLLAGNKESASLVPDTIKMFDILKSVGFSDSEISLKICDDGEHSEWFWRREFPYAYREVFS
jgi:predicted alpha/beta superfamily hydrolase